VRPDRAVERPAGVEEVRCTDHLVAGVGALQDGAELRFELVVGDRGLEDEHELGVVDLGGRNESQGVLDVEDGSVDQATVVLAEAGARGGEARDLVGDRVPEDLARLVALHVERDIAELAAGKGAAGTTAHYSSISMGMGDRTKQ